MTAPRIVVSINSCWNFVNFRAGLLRSLQVGGYEIVAAAPEDSWRLRVEQLGCRFAAVPIRSDGISPLSDLKLLAAYWRLLRRERAAAYLAFTIKPNVYGSIAARFTGTPVINNVAGLGTAFIRNGWLQRLVKILYLIAFRRSSVVFFQNPDDKALFLESGLVQPTQARLVPGSGVDLERFAASAGPRDGRFRFLYVGRIIGDKGVREFAAAAAVLRPEFPQARFQMLGAMGAANRTAIPRDEVERWVATGAVEYLGDTDDVRPFVAAADCVVLPSYREGLPRSLLEGGAMGKPLIATDVAGCRHVVSHGENGLLCAPQDAASLADAMREMIQIPLQARNLIGEKARARVSRDFSEQAVISAYLDALREATSRPGDAPTLAGIPDQSAER